MANKNPSFKYICHFSLSSVEVLCCKGDQLFKKGQVTIVTKSYISYHIIQKIALTKISTKLLIFKVEERKKYIQISLAPTTVKTRITKQHLLSAPILITNKHDKICIHVQGTLSSPGKLSCSKFQNIYQHYTQDNKNSEFLFYVRMQKRNLI